jgi:hypothetical protein
VGKVKKTNGNGANLGFEAQLFQAADKLRKNLEPSDYKHVALTAPVNWDRLPGFLALPVRPNAREIADQEEDVHQPDHNS